MYDKLRQLNLARTETEELVALLTFANSMATTYGEHKLPTPEWLAENREALRREVTSRHRDMLESRLKEVRARREALATVEEKRGKLDDEEAQLIAALKS